MWLILTHGLATYGHNKSLIHSVLCLNSLIKLYGIKYIFPLARVQATYNLFLVDEANCVSLLFWYAFNVLTFNTIQTSTNLSSPFDAPQL